MNYKLKEELILMGKHNKRLLGVEKYEDLIWNINYPIMIKTEKCWKYLEMSEHQMDIYRNTCIQEDNSEYKEIYQE